MELLTNWNTSVGYGTWSRGFILGRVKKMFAFPSLWCLLSLYRMGLFYFSFLGWNVLLYQHRMMMDDERGAIREMLGTGNRSSRRKHAPIPLCPP
jgi:hypothetical protein